MRRNLGLRMRRFDEGAATYDARAGIPPAVRAEVVRSFAALTRLEPGDLVVELGAGTGQLGACLPGLGVRYIGLDLSSPMLALFERRRARGDEAVRLVQADVNAAWPVPGAAVRVVFASRSIHLFDPEHVIAETSRVARGARASFVLGRVERDGDGVRSVLRRRMRDLLLAHGFEAPDGERSHRGVLDAWRRRGALPLAPVTAARWTVESDPASVLRAWRQKPGLGGCEPPEALKGAILEELEAWARTRFGSLDRPEAAAERYVLEGVRIPAHRPDTPNGGTT